MGAREVDVVKAIHAAWDAGDRARDLIAPDMEYVNPPDAVESGVVRDRKALARVLDVYPDFRLCDREYIEAGDEVLVLGTGRGTSATGASIESRLGFAWTVRDGFAVRLRWFASHEDALAAVGLGSEP